MRYLPLILIALVACSKPNQEASTSADTTAVAPDQTNVVQLTPEEIEQVQLAIFLRLHEYQLFGNEPGWMAHKEEYTYKDNSFTYLLVRSNPTPGYYTEKYTEAGPLYQDPNDLIEAKAAMQQEADEVNTEVPDEPEEVDLETQRVQEGTGDENAGVGGDYDEEADEGGGFDESEFDGSNYNPDAGYFVNELDTLTGSATFVVYMVSNPGDPVKTVRCDIKGYISWDNHYFSHYGEPQRDPRTYTFDDIVVELGPGTITNRDVLYLKAKIMLLTEKDIAGMSKEEISFLRNEIFARHGHSFQTKKMREHFEPLDWYFPRVEDAGPLLNAFEKQNVEFLKKREG